MLIRPPPAAETPRQVPTRAGRQRGWPEIEPVSAPGLAGQEARKRYPATGPESEAAKRLVGIFRAAREMSAARPDQRRQGVPVKCHQPAPEQPRQPHETERILTHSSHKVPQKHFVVMFKIKAAVDRDFFSLDPNPTAAKQHRRNSVHTMPRGRRSSARTWDHHAKNRARLSSKGRKNDSLSGFCGCAGFGGDSAAVAGIGASRGSHAADAFRTAAARSR